MHVTEISSKSALHYHEKGYATNWDINPYRGCEHHCAYCFAQYSHKYLENDKFFDEILAKTDIAQTLERDLLKRNWKYDQVNAGGVTDCYQPLEKHYQLMPKIIKLFIKYKNPLVITTKSTLVLRDINLLDELNKIAGVQILLSASIIDENIRKKIEPLSPATIERINMLKEFSTRGIHTTILLMPIIPYINDDIINFEKIFQLAKNNNVHEIIHACLHLRGQTKICFFDHLKKYFPEKLKQIIPLYKGSYVNQEYAKIISEKIYILRKKYKMFNIHPKIKSPNSIVQLQLI